MKLVIDRSSYKVGVNEIEGLLPAMRTAMEPVRAALKDRVYWNDCDTRESEYKSRDGFMPHSHNCGGAEIHVIIPKCEESSFPFLEFGECDDEECSHRDEAGSGECPAECDGHLDASLRVWLKFEGLDDEGTMRFWLYMGGGNGDAPYFRTQHEATVFEEAFEAKTISQFSQKAKRCVARLLAAMG
jgi:hypothetical protein